jgi:hypothetical protein
MGGTQSSQSYTSEHPPDLSGMVYKNPEKCPEDRLPDLPKRFLDGGGEITGAISYTLPNELWHLIFMHVGSHANK